MWHRAFAVFLALVTFWSALAGLEQPGTLAHAEAQAASVLTSPAPASGVAGSVEDHHLDDQPGQPGGEPADQPAWLAPTRRLVACDSASSGVAAAVLRAPHGTVPGVPLRPPRA
ncbi:MAG: hypothetical protein EOO24_11665 [Comamonadaceae bacterium]|nr:MAG: hypothetical protein EOO24_11665 [Comamonadaceae bacterium]